MAIEKCSNCLRDIGQLEQAYIYQDKIVCGECNGRLNNNPANPSTPKVQTIEKTGKKWKEYIVVGTCLTIIGLLAVVASGGVLSILVLAGGLILLLYGKIGGWWEHG